MSRSSTASSLHNFVCNYDTTQDLERIKDLERKDIILVSYFLQINHGRVYCSRLISQSEAAAKPSGVERCSDRELTDSGVSVSPRSKSVTNTTSVERQGLMHAIKFSSPEF